MNTIILRKAAAALLIVGMCISGTACTSRIAQLTAVSNNQVSESKDNRKSNENISNQVIEKQDIEISAKDVEINEKYLNGIVKIPVIKKMQKTDIEKRINRFFENSLMDFINMQTESAKLSYRPEDDNYVTNTISSDFSVTYRNENLVSFVINKNVNSDKEYGFNMKQFHVVDLDTGKEVSLYRLFYPQEDYIKIIKDYFDQREEKQFTNINITKNDINQLHFYLKDQSLVICPEQYMINRDNAQSCEVEIPFNVFKNGINTNVGLKPYAVDMDRKTERLDEKWIGGEINIPVVSGLENKNIQDKINNIFITDVQKFRDNMNKEAWEGYQDAEKNKYPFRKYMANLTFEEKKNEGNILSIYTIYYSYTGGAHGGHDDITYNIDLSTGDIIKLKSLFKEGYDYRKVLNEEIKEQIEEIHKGIKEQAIKNGEKPDDIYIPYKGFNGICEDQSFYLKDNKLGIYFGLYEIECYAAGIPTFEILLSDLKDGLKEEYFN